MRFKVRKAKRKAISGEWSQSFLSLINETPTDLESHWNIFKCNFLMEFVLVSVLNVCKVKRVNNVSFCVWRMHGAPTSGHEAIFSSRQGGPGGKDAIHLLVCLQPQHRARHKAGDWQVLNAWMNGEKCTFVWNKDKREAAPPCTCSPCQAKRCKQV